MAALITAATRSFARYVDEESLVATANIDGVDTDFCNGRRACRRRSSSSRFKRILLKSFCNEIRVWQNLIKNITGHRCPLYLKFYTEI